MVLSGNQRYSEVKRGRMCTLSPLLELGSELWGHGGVDELACVPYIHVAHDGLARAHLPSESHQRPSEESVKGNQGSSGVIGGHQASSSARRFDVRIARRPYESPQHALMTHPIQREIHAS